VEMETAFNIGEWVRIADKLHLLVGYSGFVTEFDFWKSEYRVILTKKSSGSTTYGRLWIEQTRIVSIEDSRHEEDLHSLIDFALDDNDKPYFEEILNKLQTMEVPNEI